MDQAPLRLEFEGGTIAVSGGPPAIVGGLPGMRLDPRTRVFRAEGRHYRAIVEHLRRQALAYEDAARSYQPSPWTLRTTKEPFPHQRQALDAWWQAGGRGVVVLPTGTGKTQLALMAIQQAARPALVVTPTIDLLNQWYDELLLAFDAPVGLLGGGYFEIQPLTVTTYDSAYLHLDRIGNRFGLVVFDECHHLPGPTYSLAAASAIAPFRLGLTATPERTDGLESTLPDLIGPIVYRREIRELTGAFLADYQAVRLYVELSETERQRYDAARRLYREFLADCGIDMRRPDGWPRFLQLSSRSAEGRKALLAYRDQKRIALAAPPKLRVLGRLLHRHARDRVLVFTHDNATVYQIARDFLVPAITHQTKIKERRQILQRFNSGADPIVVTSRVLNEGINIPEANVGIILSGSGSVREHVQRLGRILRKSGAKRALLYEVITRDTAEEYVSQRRRDHSAYRDR